jgi:hypothetical protein
MQNLCNGKTTCSSKADNSIFGDPCYGTGKYLEVVYQCLATTTTSTTTSSSSTTTTTSSTSSSTSSTSSSSSSSSTTTTTTSTSSSTSSTTTKPTTTTKYLYPNSFFLNAFPINTTIENQTIIKVGLTDLIAFLPSIYSYDLNDLLDPFKLSYNYYCILADKYPGDFSLDLYSIKPNKVLTQVQINAANTCFKTNGISLFFSDMY